MALIRQAAISFSHAIPDAWRRGLKSQLMIPDVDASLELLARKGFSPKIALDIGGFVGNWTRSCKSFWPDARVCIFEPQEDKQPGLNAIAQSLGGVEIKRTCLGEVPDSSVQFFLKESGSSTYQILSEPTLRPVTYPTTTLSKAVAGTPFAAPDLVKIDVQGAELSVMKGGLDVVSKAQVIMLELSFVEEYKGAPLFAEMIAFMDQLGYVVNDIAHIFRRGRYGSMNEADIIFVRKDSFLLERRFYDV